MTEIATSDKMVIRPNCEECGKVIWGIAQVFHTIGAELPAHLHAVCYERIKDHLKILVELRKDFISAS